MNNHLNNHKNFPEYFDELDKPKNKYWRDLAMLKLDIQRDTEVIEMNLRQFNTRRDNINSERDRSAGAVQHPSLVVLKLESQHIQFGINQTRERYEYLLDRVYLWSDIREEYDQLRKWSSKIVNNICNIQAQIFRFQSEITEG